MSEIPRSPIPRSPIRCVLIEPDETRRWMLSFLLQNSVVWQIVAECEALERGLVRLDALRSTSDAAELVLIGLIPALTPHIPPQSARPENFAAKN